jgi:hypothetical protein
MFVGSSELSKWYIRRAALQHAFRCHSSDIAEFIVTLPVMPSVPKTTKNHQKKVSKINSAAFLSAAENHS